MATTLLCPVPANFGGNTYLNSQSDVNVLGSVVDRRLDTGQELSAAGTVVYLDVSAHARVTHLFVKGVGISNISLDTGDVLDVTSFSVMDEQGGVSDWREDGFQNILLPLASAPVSVGSLTVTLSGVRLVEIAALDTRISLDAESRFSRMDFRRRRRGSRQHQTITGRVRSVPPVNAEPYRWELDLGILHLDGVSPQVLLDFFEAYPNFCIVPEYSRYPSRVFTEALLPQAELQLRYVDARLKQHQILELNIIES